MALTEALENFLNNYSDIKAKAKKFYQNNCQQGNTHSNLASLLKSAEILPISSDFSKFKTYIATICFDNKHHREAFIACLCQTTEMSLQQRYLSEYLMDVLPLVNQEEFFELYKAIPEVQTLITPEMLVNCCGPEAGPTENCSLLYWLSNYPNNLAKLLENNTDLGKAITGEALCIRRTDQAGAFANISALSYLCSTNDGQALLVTLFRLSPNLAKAITDEALCARLTNQAEANANTSPLYWLCANSDGQALLTTLFRLSPNLAKAITGETLCARLTDQAGAFANASALYWLCAHSDGKVLSTTLFRLSPKMAKAITGEALSARLTDQAGAEANTSPLYWLCAHSDGKALLTTLLRLSPNLAKAITGEALCARLTDQAGAFANASALYWLCAHNDSKALLTTLFRLSPNLAKAITGEALCARLTEQAEAEANTSALYWLCATTQGLIILNTLLDVNKPLADAITGEALQINNMATNPYSPFFRLCCSDYGKEILNKILLNNSNLLNQITMHMLYTRLTYSTKTSKKNILYYLCDSDNGWLLLEKILKENPAFDLAETLSADFNPLHHAIKCGHTKVVKFILLNATNKVDVYQHISIGGKDQSLLEFAKSCTGKSADSFVLLYQYASQKIKSARSRVSSEAPPENFEPQDGSDDEHEPPFKKQRIS